MSRLRFSVKVNVPEGLRQGIARAPRIAAEELIAATEWGTQHVRAAAMPLTPVGATATLRGAHQTDLRGGDARSLIRGRVFNPVVYALPVETGARPHRPPLGALRVWVRRVLGKSGRDLERATYFIGRAIGRRGTPAVSMYRRAWRQTRPSVVARFEQALARVRMRIGTGT